jgi:hypothetical protein
MLFALVFVLAGTLTLLINFLQDFDAFWLCFREPWTNRKGAHFNLPLFIPRQTGITHASSYRR